MIKNLNFYYLEYQVNKPVRVFMFQQILILIEKKENDKLKEKVANTIEKVIAINRPLSLNPMNSFERRISYLIIEKNEQVTYKTKEYGKLKKLQSSLKIWKLNFPNFFKETF